MASVKFTLTTTNAKQCFGDSTTQMEVLTSILWTVKRRRRKEEVGTFSHTFPQRCPICVHFSLKRDLAFFTSFGEWLCVWERLGKTPDWNMSHYPACLAGGEGPSAPTVLAKGHVKVALVLGNIPLEGRPFKFT